MRRAVLLFVALVAVLGGLLGFRILRDRRAAEGPPGGSGVVEGTTVDVRARLNARVLTRHVEEGARVERGALLVTLDCTEPEAGLAAGVQLGSPQALAAEEDLSAVPDDGLRVQPKFGKFDGFDACGPLAQLADDFDLDAGPGAVLKETDDIRVGELAVIDEQLFPRRVDEARKPRARVCRADDKIILPRGVRLSRRIGLKQFDGLLHDPAVLRDEAELDSAP